MWAHLAAKEAGKYNLLVGYWVNGYLKSKLQSLLCCYGLCRYLSPQLEYLYCFSYVFCDVFVVFMYVFGKFMHCY
jgi:hypothetical protein